MSAAGFIDILRRFLAKPVTTPLSATPALDQLRSGQAPGAPPAAPIIPQAPGSGYGIGPQAQQLDYAPTGFVQTGAPTQPTQYAAPAPPGKFTQYGSAGLPQQVPTQPTYGRGREGDMTGYISRFSELASMLRASESEHRVGEAVEKERRIRELPPSAKEKLEAALAEGKQKSWERVQAARLAVQATRDANLAESRRTSDALAVSRIALQECGLISKENAIELDRYEALLKQANDSLDSLNIAWAKAQADRADLEQDALKNRKKLTPESKAAFDKIEAIYEGQINRAIKDRDKYMAELTKRLGKSGPSAGESVKIGYAGDEAGGAPATTRPVQVSTPDEAEALAPGTMYTTPDGKTYKR